MDTLQTLLGYLPNIVSSLVSATTWLLTFTMRDAATFAFGTGLLVGNPVGGVMIAWLQNSSLPVLDVPFMALMFGGYITTYLAFSVIRWLIGIFT